MPETSLPGPSPPSIVIYSVSAWSVPAVAAARGSAAAMPQAKPPGGFARTGRVVGSSVPSCPVTSLPGRPHVPFGPVSPWQTAFAFGTPVPHRPNECIGRCRGGLELGFWNCPRAAAECDRRGFRPQKRRRNGLMNRPSSFPSAARLSHSSGPAALRSRPPTARIALSGNSTSGRTYETSAAHWRA